MYLVVVALVVLFLVLLYQSRTRETFVTDASGNEISSNITLSLADLMTLFSLAKVSSTPATTTPTTTTSTETTTPTTSSTPSIDAKDFYNQMRPSLLSDVSDIVSTKLAGAPFVPPTPVKSEGSSCDSDSMAQGVEFVDAKVSLEDNSDYIRKDSIPCYNCSL